jgi:integrase
VDTEMSLYRRGGVWWYKFKFSGQVIRESTRTDSKNIARDAERSRRRELELGYNGVSKAERAHTFSVAAESYIRAKTPHLAERSIVIERANLAHILPFFGKQLVTDITADDVSEYQGKRLKACASPKTINLEIGTVRAILRRYRIWANLQPDIRMLKVREVAGKALTHDEEEALLTACKASRSRSLFPAVALALNTCLRYSEIRLLQWKQIDLEAPALNVGKSKTEHGAGRYIPLNHRAAIVLRFWADLFPDCTPDHFVFPSERYGAKGGKFTPCVYGHDPARPIGDWKEAWEKAKERAGVSCRFHDLRHTGCTRMLEGGVPFPVVAEVMGWSASTAIRMAKRYGHIGQRARTDAVAVLCAHPEGAQKWAQLLLGSTDAIN